MRAGLLKRIAVARDRRWRPAAEAAGLGGVLLVLLLGPLPLLVDAQESISPAPPPEPSAAPLPSTGASAAPSTSAQGAAPAAVPASTEMVAVAGGAFFMGCNETVDTECEDNEKPGREVVIGAFEIDKTEVTVAHYARCVAAGECAAAGTGGPFCNAGKRDDHPINCVRWKDAAAYCAWVGKRLPREAEWEMAARGTDQRRYPWGNARFAAGPPTANIADASAKRRFGWEWALADYDDGFATTAPTGFFPAGASPSGALDMIGNVSEWIADAGEERRWVRGGAFDSAARDARASYRKIEEPGIHFDTVGFRCAR